MYAWFKYPSIGPRGSILPHHYININLHTKNGQGIISVNIYSIDMQLIYQKYYILKIFDPLRIGPRGSILLLPQNLLKTAYSQNF